MADDPVVILVAITPAGRLTVVAKLARRGTTLVLRGTYVQDADPNGVGAANFMAIAQALME